MQLVGNNLPGPLFEAAVIGAGPAGLATIASLIDNLSERQSPGRSFLWIDPEFNAGRLSKYSLVPSNTRVNLFVQYAKMSPCLGRLFDTLPCAHAMTKKLNPNEGCELRWAANLVKQLTDCIVNEYSQEILVHDRDTVKELFRPAASDSWRVTTASGHTFSARKVYLATGSHPRLPNAALTAPFKAFIDLEDALNPSLLAELLSKKESIAVFGSSHSAMLVLYNIFTLLPIDHRPQTVYNFYKSPLKFAKYLKADASGPVILHDNTGLKGKVAEWVQTWCAEGDESIDGNGRDVTLPCGSILRRIRTTNQTDFSAYNIDKSVFAIGYDPNAIPRIIMQDGVIDSALDLDYNAKGELFARKDGARLESLFGVGIAFPERVVDVDGSPEASVGMWKFMRYISKVVKLHE